MNKKRISGSAPPPSPPRYLYRGITAQSRSRHSGVLNSEWSHLAVSKSLVTTSTSLFRDDPPIAWYLAIGSVAITGKPCYIETDDPRPLPPAAECGFVKTLWAKLGMRTNHTAEQRNSRTAQLADLTAPLNPEPYTMSCAAREQCLIQDRTPQAPDGHLCRGVCGGRLHGLCGEVEDPDSDEPMHRICQTCAIAKATATGAG